MHSFIQLIQHSSDETPCKLEINDSNNIYYTQNWQVKFLDSEKSYISPCFVHPALKFIFKLELNDNSIRFYVGVNDYNNFDNIVFYFSFTDPSNPNTSFNIEQKEFNFNYAEHYRYVDIPITDKSLGDILNIYFELHYQMPNDQSDQTPVFNKGNVGLCQEDNLCFMNSTLQIFYHIPLIRTILYSYETSKIKDKKVLLSTVCLFREMEEATKACSAKNVCFSIDFYANAYGEQHDTDEFITRWLDCLTKEMQGSEQEEQLNDLFGFTIKSFIQTNNTPNKPDSENKTTINIQGITEFYLTLIVPIPFDSEEEKKEEHNLVDCIKEMEQKEKISNENEPDKYKWIEFNQLPPILRIDLNRFEKNSTLKVGYGKLDTPVSFPEELELHGTKYDLYAILSHAGSNSGGHYISYIRNFPSNQWCSYNDSKVDYNVNITEALKTKEMKRLAYVMFYVRREEIDRLFEQSKITQQLEDIIKNLYLIKEKEKIQNDLIKFNFYLEDEIEKQFPCKIISSSKSLTFSNKDSRMNLYKSVAELFNKKVNEIRLWTTTKSCINKRLIDKSPYSKIGGLSNDGYNFIFIQNMKDDEYVFPGSNIIDFNIQKIQYSMYIIRFFDLRMENQLLFIGTIVTNYESSIESASSEISKLLGFPEWTRYHFFKQLSKIAIKKIENCDESFLKIDLKSGCLLTVQIDFESTKKKSGLPEEELMNYAPYDLSKSNRFKDIKMNSSTQSLEKEEKVASTTSNINQNDNSNSGIPDYDIPIDINRADNYIGSHFYNRHITMFDYQDQTKPSFTINLPITLDSGTLSNSIKKIKNRKEESMIILFARKEDSDTPSEKPFNNELYTNSTIIKYNKIFYLYWPKEVCMINKIICKMEIANNGYNVNYNKFIICNKNPTPRELLQIAQESFKDFPKQILPFGKINIDSINQLSWQTCSVKPRKVDHLKVLINEQKQEQQQQEGIQRYKSAGSNKKAKFKPERTNSTSLQLSNQPPRCYEIKDFTIFKEYMLTDTIDLTYRVIRFATFIPPTIGEISVKVYQAKIDQQNMLYCIRDPFYLNVKLKSTLKEFKENVIATVQIEDVDQFLNTKVEIWHRDVSERYSDYYRTVKKSSGKFFTDDNDELIGLTEQSIVYIIY